MSRPSLVSVNVARPRVLEEKPLLFSAIDKLPAYGPVLAQNKSLEGDQVGDTEDHGGTYQAVYAFAQEDYDWWVEQLGAPLRPGLFGENLTTAGLDLNACLVGEQWRVGTARFQVTGVRTPCSTFQRWMALSGYDADGWVKRFAARGRPGVYLSILDQGWVAEGDPIEVIDRPAHRINAGTVFRALTAEPALLPLLLEVEGQPPWVYERAERYATAAGRS